MACSAAVPFLEYSDIAHYDFVEELSEMKHIISTTLLLFSFICLYTESATAQAYCALRDPVRQISELFPSSQYKSHVGVVSPSARTQVADRLPFTIHFNELGQHTLYAVERQGQTVGFIHVRPEITRWGLMEITWALDAERKVIDFAFQRCRNRRRALLESSAFKSQLQGKNFAEVRQLLNKDGSDLSSSSVKVEAQDREFATAVIRCALKTLALTDIVWPEAH